MNSLSYLCVFMMILTGKLLVVSWLFFSEADFFGGGNDSLYYEAYAKGHINVATSAWPMILRWLEEVGLYSRLGVSHVIKIIGWIFVPFLVAVLSSVKESSLRRHLFWFAALVMSVYPTAIFYSIDIYRDVFMLFVWLVGVFVFKYLSESRSVMINIVLFLGGVLVAFMLYTLRPYLGVSYLIALFFSVFYSFRGYPLVGSIVSLVIALYFLFAVGFLDPVLSYRELFQGALVGGTNLGISFSSADRFLPDLGLTIAYQLFGFHIVNASALFVFILESVPLMFFLGYLVWNRKYSNKFVDYLIIFFVVYSLVWLFGNDNLGTAVRLRMFSYVAVFVAFCVVLQRKRFLTTGE